MAYCLRGCAEVDVPVIVLDRPNPAGLRIIEGRPLEEGFESFVGLHPIPARHALTIGELARLFAEMDSLPQPRVIGIEDWDGNLLPSDYPWVYPSPNMPTPETALVYPGMCLLEATNLSEGRGTTRPFNVFGAPWVDGYRIADRLNGSRWMEGAVLRPHAFIPTFSKHAGEMCGGCEIHIVDPLRLRPLRMGLGILLEAFRESDTSWNDPPYEYEYRKKPIDILAGSDRIRAAMETGDELLLRELAAGDPQGHASLTGNILLYERDFIN